MKTPEFQVRNDLSEMAQKELTSVGFPGEHAFEAISVLACTESRSRP